MPSLKRPISTLLLISLAMTMPVATSMAAVDEAQARKAGEAAVQTVIPRKIEHKKLKLGFIPFGVKVTDITISENERFTKHPLRDWPYFATASQVDLTADLLPLLIGRISITDLNIRDFHANVLVDKNYNLNVGDLMQQKRSSLMSWLRVKSFHASGGSVQVVDATAIRGPAKLLFDDIDARFTGFAIKDKFNLDVGLRTPNSKTRNVSLKGIAGPILNTVRSEQVPLDGLLTVDKAPILPFSPYIPHGLTAYPVSGTASMKLQLKGNAWDGMVSHGGIQLENLVLASPDGQQRGKSFNMGLDIGRNVVSLKKSTLEVNDMAVSLGKNRLTVDGVIRGIPRAPVMDVDIRAPSIEPTEMEEIYPFVRAYMPKGLAYSGTTSINIHAQGDVNGLTASGIFDSSKMGVFLPEVFEKKAGTQLKVDFKAQVNPSQFTIKAKANVLGKDITMLNARLFSEGLREVLGSRISARQLSTIFKPSNTLTISQVEGVMNYDINFIRVEKMNMSELRDIEGVVGDAQVTGSLEVKTLIVHWDVDAKLSSERSRKLIKIAPSLANIADADGRIPFSFRVDGNIEQPRVSLAKSLAVR
ncbi:DUF748 domain-containing protein [Moraxellaceae bacterium AER2_44_116]|nr:DUF748 domain-containing protein [Moraxellaceae bacterium]TQC98766.1 DUF748 domain-containing protein [Moraxellaceae bacterium AER2_44_116]